MFNFNTIGTLLLAFALSAPIAAAPYEKEIEIKEGPFEFVEVLHERSDFDIKNSLGSIHVVDGAESSQIRILGEYAGKNSGKLKWQLNSAGKIEVETEEVVENFASSGASADSAPPSLGSLNVRVEIPAHLLASLKLSSSTGNIAVEGLKVKEPESKLDVGTREGTLTLKGIEGFANIFAFTRSGNINLEQSKTKKLTVESRSGMITLESVEAEEAVLDNQYGNILTVNSQGNFMAVTLSGTIMQMGHSNGSIVARSLKGAIQMNNPKVKIERIDSRLGELFHTRR